MAKAKSTFVCQQCGAVSMRWQGRCADCGEWNCIVEESIQEEGPHVRPTWQAESQAVPVTDTTLPPPPRISTGIAECDRVLGGGIVPGSLMLVGGDPGIGKSTLMLQVCHRVAQRGGNVLYVSGEESFDQTRLRAGRLDALSDHLLLLTETGIEAIRNHLANNDYKLVVVDSIQSIYSSQLAAVPGSVARPASRNIAR